MGSHHEHSHAHDTDTYFMDQLCLIGLSGGFAAICLGMYYWNTEMMDRLFGQNSEFSQYLLAGGIGLGVLGVLRAGVLWRKNGETRPAHTHDHSHNHDHDHAHHEHGHTHDHVHGVTCQADGPSCAH